MIVADPLGSWVTGAREGVEDALKLRQGQDMSAEHAYGMGVARQIDPYRIKSAQLSSDTAGLENQVTHQIVDAGLPLKNAQLAHEQALQHLNEGFAGYGMTGPLVNQAVNTTPGVTVGSGGVAFPIAPQGTPPHYIDTPFGSMVSPHYLAYLASTNYRNGQLGLGQERVNLGQERLDATQGQRQQPNGSTFLSGLHTGTAQPSALQANPYNMPLPYSNVNYAKQYGIGAVQ